MNISLEQAVSLIKNAEHTKIDGSPHSITYLGAVDTITIEVTDFDTLDTEYYEITSAEIVDNRFIKLYCSDHDMEFNVYLFNLIPIVNLSEQL